MKQFPGPSYPFSRILLSFQQHSCQRLNYSLPLLLLLQPAVFLEALPWAAVSAVGQPPYSTHRSPKFTKKAEHVEPSPFWNGSRSQLSTISPAERAFCPSQRCHCPAGLTRHPLGDWPGEPSTRGTDWAMVGTANCRCPGSYLAPVYRVLQKEPPVAVPRA